MPLTGQLKGRILVNEQPIRTSVQDIKRRPERQADEVVARRIEEIPAMSRVNVEEDTWDHYGLLLQKFLEERLQSK